MKYLKDIGFKNIQQVLFLDIETVSVVPKLIPNTPLWESWDYKIKKTPEYKEIEEKDLNELEEYLQHTYFTQSPLYFTFAKVATVSLGYTKGNKLRIKEYKNIEEKELLLELFNDINSLIGVGKTHLCGFAIFGFDCPFLHFRALINDLRPPHILDIAGVKPWNIKDYIDMKDLLNSTSWTNPSLLNCCTAFSLHSPKANLSGDGVNRLYWGEDPNRLNLIASYCSQDTLATANLFCKYIGEPLLELEVIEKNTEEPLPQISLLTKLLNGAKLTKKENEKLIKELGKYEGSPQLESILQAIRYVVPEFEFTTLEHKPL